MAKVDFIPTNAAFASVPKWEDAIIAGNMYLFHNQHLYPLGDRRLVINLFNVMLEKAPMEAKDGR